MALQFGTARPGLDYLHRPAAFGIVQQDGKLACVRVDRGEGASYFDLPGGAVDAGETEVQAVMREFREETGLLIRPEDRVAEARQYFLKTDGSPVNNAGGFWTAEILGHDPALKCEDDHELVWLEPLFALAHLRHEAHAWAINCWLRRAAQG
jgi:8-oxo-dGTP diphosphatase